MTQDLKATSKPSKKSPQSTTNSSKRSVPTEFELLSHTIRVKKNPKPTDCDKSGVAEYLTNEIRLYTEESSESSVHHTFCHELVHFLFYYAGRSDLADDETLVDTVGGLLAQYEVTKRS